LSDSKKVKRKAKQNSEWQQNSDEIGHHWRDCRHHAYELLLE
jgi:hypothetical protein